MAASYDPEAFYRLRLTLPVQVGALMLRPRSKVRLKGSVLNQIVTDYGSEVVENVTPASE